MERRKLSAKIVMMCCLALIGILAVPNTAYAKKITSDRQVEKLAKKEVKGAVVVEIDRDYEKGNLVYEVKMRKGTKEYNLTYRASDGKLIEYDWEEMRVRPSSKKMISESKCRKLAKKKVKGASIISIKLKYDDGIEEYKVKMQKGSKKYELEYHARTGKLIGYQWKLNLKKKPGNSGYIGVEKAKQIALAEVPGAAVVKAEFDGDDDGVPVYEVELVKDDMEYEFKIHAKTGKILEREQDSIYD
ncbi:MAG: hypothetical protein HFH49_13660 [Lachnospiraceae bacterium]|nr:hypothetical protein [Lachnospiraceae bacterium]